jgi:hypothetical protein
VTASLGDWRLSGALFWGSGIAIVKADSKMSQLLSVTSALKGHGIG